MLLSSSSESQARRTATGALAQLNTLTKYPSILTHHALGDRGRLTSDFTTPALFSQPLTATEKIDGTSARLLVFADGSYVVGSRENLPVPGRAEGAILRTADRSAIVKIRFEDYERTLNQRSKA